MKTLFLLAVLFLAGCSVSKKTTLINATTVKQKEFTREINFESKAGLPIISVNINGIEANFLFDTGALNVISIELAAQLNLSPIYTGYVSDSDGRKEIQEYVSIDQITIDSIDFLNNVAVVADLNASKVNSCFEIDGIIGANLLRKVFWKIDFETESIYFSDSLTHLKTSNDWNTIDFTPTSSGTPIIQLELNENKIADLIFDTGYSGNILVPKKAFAAIDSSQFLKDKTYRIGGASSSIYGVKTTNDSTTYAKVEKTRTGDVNLSDNILLFSGNSGLIGARFLANYTCILDWSAHQILIKPITSPSENRLETFGFTTFLNDTSVFVASIFQDSDAWDTLKIGDEILEINGVNYQHLTSTALCELYMSGILNFTNIDTLEITVNRNDTRLPILLEKRTLLD